MSSTLIWRRMWGSSVEQNLKCWNLKVLAGCGLEEPLRRPCKAKCNWRREWVSECVSSSISSKHHIFFSLFSHHAQLQSLPWSSCWETLRWSGFFPHVFHLKFLPSFHSVMVIFSLWTSGQRNSLCPEISSWFCSFWMLFYAFFFPLTVNLKSIYTIFQNSSSCFSLPRVLLECDGFAIKGFLCYLSLLKTKKGSAAPWINLKVNDFISRSIFVHSDHMFVWGSCNIRTSGNMTEAALFS